MKTTIFAAPIAAAILSLLAACSSATPPSEVRRPVRSVELHYDEVRDVHRYFASVQSRREVDQAFRVAGKVTERRVDVGQIVAEGDVLAVLDDVDYRLAEDAARRQLEAAEASQRQTESDWQRLHALKNEGSVSVADEEQARSAMDTAHAGARAESRKLELARNQVAYTVLRASRSGVITALRLEVGQVIAAGQPVVALADPNQSEIVVDIPEDHLERIRQASFQAFLASAPDAIFAVDLRELSAQAAAQTRTYRARLKPQQARPLPLGASATLIAEVVVSATPVASVPASALTLLEAEPAVWVARPIDGTTARVELVPVQVHGYRNDEVLLSGPEEGARVVAAGVQKMSPGLMVTVPVVAVAAATDRGTP